MQKVKVKIHQKRQINILNDLSNAAYYLHDNIQARSKKGDREGIGLEIMACLALQAFAIEAKINFLGAKLVKNWNERRDLKRKIKCVSKALGKQSDFGNRPYKTIGELVNFRNMVAHGKPKIVDREEIVTLTHEELEALPLLSSDLEEFTTEKFLARVDEDIDAIWKQLLEASKLEIFDTLTHGSTSVTFIENVNA